MRPVESGLCQDKTQIGWMRPLESETLEGFQDKT